MDVQQKHCQIVSILDQINRLNNQQDISSFQQVWINNSEQFLKQARFLASSWQAFRPIYQQELQRFLDIIREILESFGSSQIFLPKLSEFLTFISKINDQQQIKKVKKAKPSSLLDQLFKDYLSSISSRKYKQSSFIRNDYGQKVLLQNYISQLKQYLYTSQIQIRWQYIYRRIQSYYNFNQILNDDTLKQHQLMDDYLNNIQSDKVPSIQCIGCCRFFFTNTNIYHPQYNNTELVLIGQAFKMKESQTKLKNEICRLLNGNGGIILFDCVKRYRDIIPMGDLLIPQVRAEFQQRITSFMQTIYPRPQPQNFTITFVPLVRNPLEHKKHGVRKKVTDGSTFESSYFQRDYIDGFYVTRIKIQPITGQKLYFWVNDSKPIFPVSQIGSMNFIQGKQISRMIKKRFKKYYIPENAPNIKQLKLMRPKLSHFHAGKCEEPSLGVELAGMYKRPDQIHVNLQHKYKDVSMVIARRSDLTYIKQRLSNKNYKCEISPKFTEYKFKYSNSSALMYHDTRFDILLNEISNRRQYQFANRYTKLLCITTFIKLQQKNGSIISLERFLQIQEFFNKQYPNEQIKLWSYTDGQVDFYFQVDRKSKLKTVFLFYILSDLYDKVTFRNPKNFDKFTPQMINSRFKLIYPANSRFQNKYFAELYYESNNSSANSFNGSQSK